MALINTETKEYLIKSIIEYLRKELAMLKSLSVKVESLETTVFESRVRKLETSKTTLLRNNLELLHLASLIGPL